jgi:hypothetical protein
MVLRTLVSSPHNHRTRPLDRQHFIVPIYSTLLYQSTAHVHLLILLSGMQYSFLGCGVMCSPAQRCTNFERRVAVATKFFMMAPNIFGSPVRTLPHVNVLAPKILRWLQNFCNMCSPRSSRHTEKFQNTFFCYFKKQTTWRHVSEGSNSHSDDWEPQNSSCPITTCRDPILATSWGKRARNI